MDPDSTIRLTIPGDPAALRILRVVSAGLAAAAELTIDAIEDVCLAVDEAVLQIVGAGADRVRISIEASPAGIHAEVGPDGAPVAAPTSDDAAIGREILAALVDELHLDDGVVRFSKRRAGA